LRQAVWGLHRRLAPVLGLWVAFQSLTGLVLLFGDPIEHWRHAELTRHGQGDRGAADVLSVVRQNYPGEDVGVIATPAVSDGVYVVEVGQRESRGSGVTHRSVYVDPSGPRINGSRAHDAGFVALVRRLHRRLLFDSLLGLSGTWVVGTLAVAWLCLSLGGATSAAVDRLSRRWRRDPSLLRGLVGVLVVVPIVVVVVTGVRLALPAGTDRIWAAVTGSGQGRADVPPAGVRITSEDRGGTPRDAGEILAVLGRRYPDGRVARLLMPQPDDRVAPVIAGLSAGFDPGRGEHDYGGNTVVFVDQFSAETLWVGRPDALPAARQATLLWSRPLHTGSVVGEPGRILWGWLALALAVVSTLGWVAGRSRVPSARARQLRWERQFRRRKALARRQRAQAARATRTARLRRRTSRRLRRRRRVQARTLARMGRMPPHTPAHRPPPTVAPSDDDVEIDLTDDLEIDLTDRADVESEFPGRFPPA
jgi:uncharacterized iron-regulated membrane protein